MDNIEKRRAALDQFIKESEPVLLDFANKLGINNPELILSSKANLIIFLKQVETYLEEVAPLSDEQYLWVTPRLGYLLGAYFIKVQDGYWAINENEASFLYGRIVVFAKTPSQQKAIPIDVFETAKQICSDTQVSILSLIEEIEKLLI